MTNGTNSTTRAFKFYGLLAETFIHPGTGQARGGIDLPVSREATTGYPYIAGSSGKGAARDAFRRHWWTTTTVNGESVLAATDAEKRLFGPDAGGAADGAGELIFSDMRLLLLPVRSLTSACRYLVCPEIIYRLLTDLRRAGSINGVVSELATAASDLIPDDNKTAISKDHNQSLYLEELCFEGKPSGKVAKLAACISHLLPNDSGMAHTLEKRLTIVSDDAFAWFAENALPTRMRNALDERKKVKDGALWSEEYLAPDTLMYMLIGTRGSPLVKITLPDNGQLTSNTTCNVGDAFQELLAKDRQYFQVGGNETVGQGWFRVKESSVGVQASQTVGGGK